MLESLLNKVAGQIFNTTFEEHLRTTASDETQAWQGMASDHMCMSQHVPKIILGALLSRTLNIRIARLFLIFKLQH